MMHGLWLLTVSRSGNIHAFWVRLSQETVLDAAISETLAQESNYLLMVEQLDLCCPCLCWCCYRHHIKTFRIFKVPFCSVIRRRATIHDRNWYAYCLLVFDRILGSVARTDVQEVWSLLERRCILYSMYN